MTVIPPYVIDNTRDSARSAAIDYVHGGRKTVYADWSPGDMTRYRLMIIAPTDATPYYTVENLGVPGSCHRWTFGEVTPADPEASWWPNNDWACAVIGTFLDAFAKRALTIENAQTPGSWP